MLLPLSLIKQLIFIMVLCRVATYGFSWFCLIMKGCLCVLLLRDNDAFYANLIAIIQVVLACDGTANATDTVDICWC